MLLTLSANATSNLKKTTEVLLEGSEKALLTLSSKEVRLQTVDATWTCTAIYSIPRSQFSVSAFSRCAPVSVKFNLKALHQFLKTGGTRVLAFRYNDEGEVRLIGTRRNGTPSGRRASQTVLLAPVRDRCPYVSVPESAFRHWLNVKVDPDEFSNITLDLATGGGHMEMLVYGNNMVVFQSLFDTGNVHFRTHDFVVSQNGVQRPTRQGRKRKWNGQLHASDLLVQEKFIVKFLKLVCGLASLCVHMGMYLQSKSPLVMVLRFACQASLTMCLIPSP